MLWFTRKARKTFSLPFCSQLLLGQQRADSYDDAYQILTLNSTRSESKLFSDSRCSQAFITRTAGSICRRVKGLARYY